MRLEQETLSKVQSIASILSAIALPIVLAVIGYVVQDKLSSEGIKKDYVGIAVGILKDRSLKEDDDMRKWAVAVLDSNSPVPFSKDLKARLERGTSFVPVPVACPGFPPSPTLCMEAPQNVVLLGKKDPKTGKELPVTHDDLLVNVFENASRFHDNRLKLECLQTWIREMTKLDEEFRSEWAKGFKKGSK